MFDYDYLYQVDAAVSSVLEHHTVGEVDPWGRSVHQGGGQGARVIVAAAVGEVVAAADCGEQQHLRREKRVLYFPFLDNIAKHRAHVCCHC